MITYIIPIHPQTEAGDKHRLGLFMETVKSLLLQSCPDWQAIVVGGPGAYRMLLDGDPRYIMLDSPGGEDPDPEHEAVGDKHLKIEAARRYLDGNGKTVWVARLDDDDLISSTILERIKEDGGKFDGYWDSWHWFYDPKADVWFRQLRQWTPNTTIMRWDDARPLIAGKHGAFHSATTNWCMVDEDEPVYVRVMHSSSVSKCTYRYEIDRAAHPTVTAEGPPKGFA